MHRPIFLIAAAFVPGLLATSGFADTLLRHDFSGASSSALSGISPTVNNLGTPNWVASSIIAANGEVNDGTNTDRGAYVDLGTSFVFKKNSVYTLKLDYSGLENAILFAGFAVSTPAVESQMQVQGTNFALRIRDQPTVPGKGLWKNPGSLFTAGTASSPAGSGTATLTLSTAELTNATASVEGSAAQAVDLSGGYRYLWIAFEDPSAAAPASSARFTLLQLDGPLPDPPAVTPSPVAFVPASGIVQAGQSLALSSETPGAQIRYTRDGSEPDEDSEPYVGPLLINSSGEVRAKAFKDGLGSPAVSAFHAVVPSDKPNIVLIVGDNIGAGDLSSFGSVGIHTPHLDQLARQGVRFTGASLDVPGAVSGLQSILTGRSGRRTGAAVSPAGGGSGLKGNEWTLAEVLRKAGYATAFVGSWDLADSGTGLPHHQGYQLFKGIARSSLSPVVPPLQSNDDIVDANPDPASFQAYFKTAAVSFLEANAGARFFLTLRVPPLPAASGDSVQGSNGNRIESFDGLVGDVVSALDNLSLADETLVVFSSSSSAIRSTPGPSLGTNALFRDGDGSTWEGGLRVPVIARWPGVIVPNVQSVATLPLVDVFRDVATLAGGWLPADRPFDGVSRPEILLGTRNGLTPDVSLASSWNENGSFQTRSFRKGNWKLHLSYHNTDAGNTFSQAAPLLFDLAVDPSERINRASSQQALVAELTGEANSYGGTYAPTVVQLPPSRPAFIGPVASAVSGGAFTFIFTRPEETLHDRYQIEVSEDLSNWTRLPLEDHLVSTESVSSSAEKLTVIYQPVSAPSAGRLFARLRGTNP